jgi:3-deoxy-manno-octulosonate cytidylyltransferase (CMP-KDO synthetase)
MIIIPARLASSRFPKKVLADINGLPMVIATAKRVEKLDKICIATDSQEVIDLAKKHGYQAVMTSESHQSGTDRIFEAAEILGLGDDEAIINVQADEPFIEPEVVQKVIDKVKNLNRDFTMVSCYRKMDPSFSLDPNHVKVITDVYDDAIYFSRSKIPYDREEHFDYFGHLGIYGFDKKSLKAFCQYRTAPLENIEKLEQLRAIYNGHKIAMVEVNSKSFGIDSKEDLTRALKELS